MSECSTEKENHRNTWQSLWFLRVESLITLLDGEMNLLSHLELSPIIRCSLLKAVLWLHSFSHYEPPILVPPSQNRSSWYWSLIFQHWTVIGSRTYKANKFDRLGSNKIWHLFFLIQRSWFSLIRKMFFFFFKLYVKFWWPLFLALKTQLFFGKKWHLNS